MDKQKLAKIVIPILIIILIGLSFALPEAEPSITGTYSGVSSTSYSNTSFFGMTTGSSFNSWSNYSSAAAKYMSSSEAAAVSGGVGMIYASLAFAILALLIALACLVFNFVDTPGPLKGKELVFPVIGAIFLILTIGLYYAGVSAVLNAFVSGFPSTVKYTTGFSLSYGAYLIILALVLNIVYVILSLTSWKKTPA